MRMPLPQTTRHVPSSAPCRLQAGEPCHAASGQQQDFVRVSVVVPTCGRPQLLHQCLGSLVGQQIHPRHFEIIVVDDAIDSTHAAATCNIVGRWMLQAAADGPLLRYLPPTGPLAPHGPAAARNRGWRAARGAIIAFTDDDTQARADWLVCGLAAFAAQPGAGSADFRAHARAGADADADAKPDANADANAEANADAAVDAAWGRITMPLHGPASDYELDAKGLERAEFVTANCFCRRSALARIDGFDERFRLAWREDADLYFRLLDDGARVVHVPQAVVVHPIRPARWGVSLAQQRKVLFDALLFKKHPRRYRQKIRATPRWDYYATVTALLAAIAAAAGGHRSVALAAAGFWLLQTGLFCLRRLRPAIKTPAHVLEMMVTSVLIPPLAVFWRLVGALRFRVGFL